MYGSLPLAQLIDVRAHARAPVRTRTYVHVTRFRVNVRGGAATLVYARAKLAAC